MTPESSATELVAIYLRISRDDAGTGLAIDRQREDANALARERGWSVFDTYIDHGISAYSRTARRPAYERMRDDYAAGQFKSIICWDLDRLTRQPRQLEDWIDAAELKGLNLVTLNGEADLGNDGGRMYARIKAAVARAEMERKGARQTRAIAQKVELGKMLSGVRLTGYNTDGTVNDQEAVVVRDMFGRFAAGESLKGLARLLDESGVPTRRGGPWSASSVRTMLLNGRYAGRVILKGKDTGHKGVWTPIVSDETFDLVQARLNDPRRKTSRQGTARKWLGSGIFRCGVCDRAVRTNGNRYWCPEGDHVIRAMPPIDELVLKVAEARLSDPAMLSAFRTRDDAAAAELNVKAENLRARLATIEADYDAGLIDGLRFKTANDKVKTELKAIQGDRARLVGDTAVASVLAADDPATAFRDATLDARRAVLDALMTVHLNKGQQGSKVFDPETVKIELKGLIVDSQDWWRQELRDELREEFMLDPNIPLSTRFEFAKVTADYRWVAIFTDTPAHKFRREQAMEQQVSNEIYDDFAARLVATTNIATWLKKRQRTPEVVLLHRDHEIGLSISFRTPGDGDGVKLAWDIRPYGASEVEAHPFAQNRSRGSTRVRTTKGSFTGRDIHGEPVLAGGSYFDAKSNPIEVAFDVYRRERDAGAEPAVAGREASNANFEALHNYAPTRVEFGCWCGQKLHPKWSSLMKNVERSLKPGHVRIENKRIIALIPLY